MTAPPPADIAKGLTAPLEQTLLWLHPDIGHARIRRGVEAPLGTLLVALKEARLCAYVGNSWWRLTPPGAAVRAILALIPQPAAAPAPVVPGRTRALTDAVWQVLDDMGAQGTSCCVHSKAVLRAAFEPFSDPECPPDMPLEAAHKIIADVQAPPRAGMGEG